MSRQCEQKLRCWRRQKGFTQLQAAEYFGVSRQQWWRWEQGRETPSAAYMIELHREGVAQPNDFYDLPAIAVRAA